MPKEKIRIEYLPVSQLKEYPDNPRSLDQKSKDDLKRSIRKHNFLSPLLVNSAPGRENIVLSGSQRLIVSRELKIKEVPVVRTRVEDPKIEREIVLLGNINNGEWNYEILKNWDIDTLLKSGMKDFDLSAIWDSSLETEDDDFNTEQELSKIIKPKTKPGQIYLLGNHILGCGDARDKHFVQKLMRGQKVDMVYCDPIYNINLDYNKGLGGKSSYGGKINDNMSDADYKVFLKTTIENALAAAKPDCHVFYYNDQRNIGLIQEIYREVGIENKRVCLWIKNGLNPTPEIAFNKSFEPAIYGTRGKPYISPKFPNFTEILNKEIATGNRQIDDILDILDIWLVKRLAGQKYSHSAEKPVSLHEKALRRCTKVNDIVLDLFCGSFSTGIACEQLKRKCITADIDAVFCDLAIKRFEAYSGQKAKLIGKE
ncbi:MAG: DNA modification methylase [bacterium]